MKIPHLAAVGLAISLTSPLLAQQVSDIQLGEGEEVIVASGIVVREVPAELPGDRPLLAVGTSEGVHHLYDPNQFTMLSMWAGIFGREDADGQFVPELREAKGFSIRASPWSFGEGKDRQILDYVWRGYELREDRVFFKYQISSTKTGVSWDVEESLEVISALEQEVHFTISPSEVIEDDYLSYWLFQTDFRRLSTNGQPNQRNKLKNLFPDQRQFTISFLRRRAASSIPAGYLVESLEIPNPKLPQRFEPTAIDFAQDGTAFVTTRTGGVWRRGEGEGWSVFADGLHETNGVLVEPGGGVLVMQKPELTRLEDGDGDGVADLYASVESRFRFAGTYHEFAYGPCQDSAGNLYFSLGLQSRGQHKAAPDGYAGQMGTPTGYRGWMMRHGADGLITPFASGLRSPAGIGINADDEIFVTDNQGDFVPSSYLAHVEEGDFLGHPASEWDRPDYGLTPEVFSYRYQTKRDEVPEMNLAEVMARRKPPAVWLAHNDLTNSPGHPAFAPSEGFGPFGGQAFIADIAHRNVIRVALERVGGQYQGAAFPFIRPLQSSAYATAFDPEGNLWIGSVGRGWTAGDPAVEIIRADPANPPFEIHRIAITQDGFALHLTRPLAAKVVVTPADIGVKEYRYRYWDGYGSEPIDEAELPAGALKLSEDRRVIGFAVPRKEGFIYQISVPVWESTDGAALINNYGHYTLNQLLR